jgi:hypothetical protein
LIASGGTQYFWFNVSVPGVNGTQAFTVLTNDTSGNPNSTSVNVTVNDVTWPKWFFNSTYPSSPASYSSGRNYGFQINWTENVGINTVLFETNLNESLKNFTVSLHSGSSTNGIYVINFTDISTGAYQYKWFADDSAGNANSTSTLNFNITNGTNSLNLYLNNQLNQNITVNNGTTFTINATSACRQSGCKINIIKDGTISVASDCETYCNLTDTLYLDTSNTHSYNATAVGNANYSDNSTGITYYVTVIYPSPRYSVSTSIPSSYSPADLAIFEVTWTDDNDPNGFNVSYIEGNWSGSATNYTMSRSSGTNKSTYNINLSAGAYTWKAYANNYYNSWNSTPQYTFTIGKAKPNISLIIAPSWDVYTGEQTTVSCSADHVSVSLYRNGSSVSNPEIQTFDSGAYLYKCNNTAIQNYSSTYVTKTLTVTTKEYALSFIRAESLIFIQQNSTNSTIVEVKNIGNRPQDVDFTLEDINSSWYVINSTDASLDAGEKAAFLVDFAVGLVDIGNYEGNFKAYSSEVTKTSNFTLRVLPSEENEIVINDTLANYTSKMVELEEKINASKAEGINVSSAESKLDELKTKIDEANGYIQEEDYFSVHMILSEIETLEAETRKELNKALEKEEFESLMIYVIIGVCVFVAAVLIYLFWPVGTKPRKDEMWFKLKKTWEKLIKKKKYRYK